MLVVNERGDAPYTEKVVAGWLRSCRVPGLAVASGHVPGRGRAAGGQEADFIVFTPNVCVCIEVKGTLSRTGGTLSCPVNGRWTMPGFPGDPVHVRKSDVNPLDQARSAMFSLKSMTEAVTGANRFVSALVVVVPLSGTVVTLDKPSKAMMPKGVDVLLGDRPHELFSWFQRGRSRASVWTAERVAAMLDVLGVNDPVASMSTLTAEGFPSTATASRPVATSPGGTTASVTDDDPFRVDVDPFAPATRWRDSEPHASVGSSAPAGTKSSFDDHHDSWRQSYGEPVFSTTPVSPPPGRRPAFPAPTPRTEYGGGRARVRSALLALTVMALVGFGVWYTVGVDHPRSRHDSTGGSGGTSVTEAPAPTGAPPGPADPAPMGDPGFRPCYPLQPDC
ncbi:NERD domain-containing protein [Nocardia veterana]|uniref:NERD domain-containing protein n=1 Tax=Nocardia veterana TaxID=132249 RepID=A0A7X6LZT6_9NOCA|nr:NERD domain-containing protein [Nocardia veterana]